MPDRLHNINVLSSELLPTPEQIKQGLPLTPAAEDFVYPPGRSERYTIVEVSMFEGRSVEAKKQLIRLLYARAAAGIGLAPEDLEITIAETPRHCWGIRGLPGDELELDYRVSV